MKQRIITGFIAGAAFLLFLSLGSDWFTVFIVPMSIIGYYEFTKMNGFKPITLAPVVGFIAVIYLVFPWERFNNLAVFPVENVIWLLMFMFFAITVLSKNKTSIDSIAMLFIGVIYIGIGFHYMIYTRNLEHGLYWTLLLFICIWATDSGAYFIGKILGKHSLWPSISPNKTMEGAVGGFIASIIAAIAFSLYSPALLGILHAIVIGMIVAIVGQMGDLVQSAYKRVRGIKDTGAILPGHGGVLDRCDSWLMVFPFVHLLYLVPHI